ncbi:MAG: hypothetical protein DPW09_01985 [Anaerolineae bacterium]|nr:hypothetical protein [Anaerolineae bacterium]MCQ3972198.1 hypothetical protein [Anaerolineae bacterium]
MTNQKSKTQFYNLAKQDEYDVAAHIVREVITKGQSSGWLEREPGEEDRLAQILLRFNIELAQPGVWKLRPPDVAVIGGLDLGGLNQAVAALNGCVQQANMAYASSAVSQMIYAKAAGEPKTAGAWYDDLCLQIAAKLGISVNKTRDITRKIILSLAGIPELEPVDFSPKVFASLVRLARMNPTVKHLTQLQGFFLGETQDGQQRSVVVTFEDDGTLCIEIFDGYQMLLDETAGNLTGYATIDLRRGTIRSEPLLYLDCLEEGAEEGQNCPGLEFKPGPGLPN